MDQLTEPATLKAAATLILLYKVALPLLSGIYVAVPLGYALRVRCARRADRGGYQLLAEEPLVLSEA